MQSNFFLYLWAPSVAFAQDSCAHKLYQTPDPLFYPFFTTLIILIYSKFELGSSFREDTPEVLWHLKYIFPEFPHEIKCKLLDPKLKRVEPIIRKRIVQILFEDMSNKMRQEIHIVILI